MTSGETIFDKVPALSESCKMGCIGGLFYNVNARPKRCFATGLFVIVSFDLLPEDNSENLRESWYRNAFIVKIDCVGVLKV